MELTIEDLLEEEDLEDEVFFLQLAGGDFFKARELYENTPAVEVYRHYAKLETIRYYSRQESQRSKFIHDRREKSK